MKNKRHWLENRDRSILQAAMDGFWLTDIHGNILEVNDSYCKMSGYSEQKLLSMNVADLEAIETPHDVLTHMQEIIKNGSDRFQTKHRRKDGTAFDVEISVLFRNEESTRCVCFLRDITDRKKSERKLIKNEAKLKNTLAELSIIHKNVPVALLVVDRDRRVQNANEFAANFAQRFLGEMIGLRGGEALRCLHHLDTPEGCGYSPACSECKVRNTVLETFETQTNKNEIEAWLPFDRFGQKKALCFLINTAYIQFDDAEKVLLCAQDITERKNNEIALQASEEKFRLAFDSSPDSININRMDGTFIEINKGFTRLTGYSKEDVIGKTSKEINIWCNPTDRDTLAKKLKEMGICENLESTFRCKDGSITTALMSARILTINDEPHILSITRDIQERIYAEKARSDLEKQLYQAQKMEAVGHLAGGVAHDYNNMLGVILGHSEMALDEIDCNNPIFNHLKLINDAAKRSADITRQLLVFARKQVITPKVTDINPSVEGLVNMLRRLIGENIALELNLESSLWKVKIDPSQLDQILVNLCVNSRDAISDVGTITIQTSNHVIDEECCKKNVSFKAGDYVVLAVSDTGCGMDNSILERIFEPFFTTKTIGEGTGLGLATVYGIVKQSHGFINTYSKPGQGTTFEVYLPKYLCNTDQVEYEEISNKAKGGVETVLLVEDDSTIMDMTSMMLMSLGYSVIAKGTPSEAIRTVEESNEKIQLLITDLVMPDMNGKELSEKLLAQRPDMKTLFISGYTADIIDHHGVSDNGIHFLQKPFSKKDLATKIRKILD